MSKFGNKNVGGKSPDTSKLRRLDLSGLLPAGEQESLNNQQAIDYSKAHSPAIQEFHEKINQVILQRLDLTAISQLSPEELRKQIEQFVFDYANEIRAPLSIREQRQVAREMLNDMIGLGPLEPIFADENITEVMINGPNQIYIERSGKLMISDARFRDEHHLQQIAQRIATRVGRRVDSSSPLCDARLPDGSRVNIVLPPIALDGTSISIRKFPKHSVSFDKMVDNKTLAADLARLLKISSQIGLNIIVSGGTSSGKTTMLNALSRLIDNGERIVTCEDAAELRLQQPHVVRLESRPQNIEGKGEITIRDLVRNALRMRPDRIIVGEVRGSECIDMLQAMNTGHDGSMSTVHANSAREAVIRLENMVAMSGFNLPNIVAKKQIAGAINIIVQVERMHDGVRRITEVVELTGVEGDQVMIQGLFRYVHHGMGADGKLLGTQIASGLVPKFVYKAAIYGLAEEVLKLLKVPEAKTQEVIAELKKDHFKIES